jgi:hypothetical protein
LNRICPEYNSPGAACQEKKAKNANFFTFPRSSAGSRHPQAALPPKRKRRGAEAPRRWFPGLPGFRQGKRIVESGKQTSPLPAAPAYYPRRRPVVSGRGRQRRKPLIAVCAVLPLCGPNRWPPPRLAFVPFSPALRRTMSSTTLCVDRWLEPRLRRGLSPSYWWFQFLR